MTRQQQQALDEYKRAVRKTTQARDALDWAQREVIDRTRMEAIALSRAQRIGALK